MNKEISYSFDNTLGKDWSIDNGGLLDRSKIKNYISTVKKDVVKEFFDNQIEINHSLFMEALTRCFENFRNSIENKEFYLMTPLLPSSKMILGRQDVDLHLWLITLLWKEIRDMNGFQGFIDYTKKVPKEGANILVILDYILFNDLIGFQKKVLYLFQGTCNVHIVVPFIRGRIPSNRRYTMFIYSQYVLPELKSVINDPEKFIGITAWEYPFIFDHVLNHDYSDLYQEGLYIINGKEKKVGNLLKKGTSYDDKLKKILPLTLKEETIRLFQFVS